MSSAASGAGLGLQLVDASTQQAAMRLELLAELKERALVIFDLRTLLLLAIDSNDCCWSFAL